jgi:serine/threonine protein kinase
MKSPTEKHPSADELRAFGVGRLDPAASDTVVQHLETCADCRQVVAESSGDSFLSRLRAAKPGSVLSADGTAAYVPRSNEIPPELANNPEYEELVELGRGGMGVVYMARNTLMGRLEVLKVMNKEMMSKPGAVDRFRREVQSAARLDHPNIVRAYSARMLGELLVFTMEFVPGEELGKLVRARGRLPIMHACYYAQQVANGLQHAHEKGMVHRDIKPANLILRVEGKKHTIKILDFGLAKLTSERGFDAGLTGEGRMLGTPDYIAPEQIVDAQSAGIHADIYSLGCTLYYLLAGHPPFQGSSLFELLKKHQEETAPPLALTRPEVPDELAGVVAKMMAKDPSRRFQTPAEVAKALAPFVKPGVARPRSTLTQPAMPVVEPLPDAAKPAGNMWETMAIESIAGKALAAKPRRTRGNERVWALLGVVALAVIVFIGLWASGIIGSKSKDEQTAIVEKKDSPSGRALNPDRKTELPREKNDDLSPLDKDQKTEKNTKADPPASPPMSPPGVPVDDLRAGRILAPDLSKAEVLLKESKSGGLFERISMKERTYDYEDDKYSMRHAIRVSSRSHYRGTVPAGPCAIELSGRVQGQPSDAWGIQLNNFEQKVGFKAAVNGNGQLTINPGYVSTYGAFSGRSAGPFAHSAIKTGQDFNTLLLIVRAESIEIYVNGVAVCDPIEIEKEWKPNRLQLTLDSRQEARAEFRSFTVRSAEDVPTLAERLSKGKVAPAPGTPNLKSPK